MPLTSSRPLPPALQEDMAEKAKQHRFSQLHINQLYKRLEPLEAAVAAAAAAAAQPLPPPPQAAPPREPEVVCRLMLCMVYEQPQPSAAEIAEAAARLAAEEAARQAAERQRVQAAAATRLQAAARGFLARRRLAAQHTAATTIQAGARGFLVRQALATIWEQEELQQAGAVHAAAAAEHLSPAQRLAQRRRGAELQYQQRTAAAKVNSQKRLQPARPGARAPSRGANTAVEAAARRRGLLSPSTVGDSDGGSSGAERRGSALLLAGGGGKSGAGNSPTRRPSSLGGLASGSPILRPSGLLGAGAAAAASRGGQLPGQMAGTSGWAGSSAAAASMDGAAGKVSSGGDPRCSATGGTGGSPARRPGNRLSVSAVPRLHLGQHGVQMQGTNEVQAEQADGQAQQEPGGEERQSEAGNPTWQPAGQLVAPEHLVLAPGPGGQPRKQRRESLGFGSSKPRH